MTVSDSMKEKIKKLLAMTTERGATEAEAQVAMEKANQLLKEHNLNFADINSLEEKKDHREEDRFPAYPWARTICAAVAHLYDCIYYYNTGEDLRKTNHIFVGRKGNSETALLIAEFVVKTVLKEALKAQKAAGQNNRYATDFAQGAAARLSEKAYALWREANAEKIKEQRERQDASMKVRNEKRLDAEDLKPGYYQLRCLDDKYVEKKEFKLVAEQAMETFKALAADPPRGVYVLSLKCLEGEMASEESYTWRIKDSKSKNSLVKNTVKNWEAYDTGRSAAENIGLRIQVGAEPPKGAING